MDDEAWAAITSQMTGDVAPAVDEAATEAAAPEAESPLTAESPAPEAVVESTPEPVVETAPVAEVTPAPEVAEPPVQTDWREHPDAKAVLEKAQRMELLEQRAIEARRIQHQSQFQQQLNELADGDSDRLQTLTGVIAQATTPLQQMAHAEAQRANGSEKAAAALFIAMEAELDDAAKQRILARHGKLMSVEGVDVMQQIAFGERDYNAKLNQAVAAKDAEIAELRKQVAARAELAAREASGADAVDGGGGNNTPPDRRQQLREAGDFDAYWSAFTGRAA